jgi:hypothetical protein
MKTTLEIYLIAFIFILNGCYSVKEISTFKDLVDAHKDGEIQIVTRDTTVYYADKFSYSDSSINIRGIKKKSDLETEYEGSLYFKDIAYIQYLNSNFMQGLLIVGATGLIAGYGSSVLSGTSGIEAVVKIVYPSYGGGGSGSCPYIYSWDGNNYKLEGEAFGTALGKALETETAIVLRDLEPSKKRLKIKLTNERPETHFFNNIKLVAVETDKNETVYADNRNWLCKVKKHKKIFKALDRNKIEVTNLFMDDDNNYWKSDLSSAKPESKFEDQIIVELKDIEKVDSIFAIISAINSEISSVVFSYLQKLLGDEFANFTNAAETDPEVIEILKKTLYRSALKIDIWDGTNWKYADLIYPEANQVEFKKLVRLPVIKNNNNVMKIRLRCLSDVWEIDAISYDDSPLNSLIIHQPELLYHQLDAQSNLNSIIDKDELYSKLLPGQSIQLEYGIVRAPQNKKITYAITVGGYLYEWLIDNSAVTGDGIKNLSTSTPKLLMVKEILKNIYSILPMIYSEWKKNKSSFVVNE